MAVNPADYEDPRLNKFHGVGQSAMDQKRALLETIASGGSKAVQEFEAPGMSEKARTSFDDRFGQATQTIDQTRTDANSQWFDRMAAVGENMRTEATNKQMRLQQDADYELRMREQDFLEELRLEELNRVASAGGGRSGGGGGGGGGGGSRSSGAGVPATAGIPAGAEPQTWDDLVAGLPREEQQMVHLFNARMHEGDIDIAVGIARGISDPDVRAALLAETFLEPRPAPPPNPTPPGHPAAPPPAEIPLAAARSRFGTVFNNSGNPDTAQNAVYTMLRNRGFTHDQAFEGARHVRLLHTREQPSSQGA